MIFNRLAATTLAQAAYQKVSQGNNNLSDWVENAPIGYTGLGTPYLDSVRFKLSDTIISDEYINCTISANNNAKIVKNYIRGSKNGTIKQMIDPDDWNITFTIDIFAPFLVGDKDFEKNQGTTEIRKIGNSFVENNVLGLKKESNLLKFIGEPNSISAPNNQYHGNYYPNDELRDLLDLFSTFYNDNTYKNIEVESLYLNNNIGVEYIVPHSISTNQNHSVTNSYRIVINAYSDTINTDIFKIPNR